MGGSWRLAEAIQAGAVAGIAPRPFRAKPTAIVRLAKIQNPDPIEESAEAIYEGPRSSETSDRESPAMRAGLSLPARSWTIIGAAAAIWAMIAVSLLLAL